jgi:lipopolysaccharide/colanic/teichoic acid biosynthesis glycosyltransferase
MDGIPEKSIGVFHEEVSELLLDPDLASNGTAQPSEFFPSPDWATVRVAREPSATPSPQGVRPREAYVPVKLAADVLVASLLSLITLPLVILAALLVKLSSRGPAFYSQVRLGRNGKPFKIYKIRTMFHECELLSGPRWSTPGDARITSVGRVLRSTHLDELPQLLNVVRGQMSLIGPRPERPEFLSVLEQALPSYRRRLLVRPGVTGLAQVHLPADTDLCSVRRKLAYDLYYIQRMGPWLDLQILLCTFLYALGVPFRWSRRLFHIPAPDAPEESMQVPVIQTVRHGL